MSKKRPDLGAAYALQTPDDSRQLYAEWSATYDSDFIDATGYLLPQHVARVYARLHGGGTVLDLGAGMRSPPLGAGPAQA